MKKRNWPEAGRDSGDEDKTHAKEGGRFAWCGAINVTSMYISVDFATDDKLRGINKLHISSPPS